MQSCISSPGRFFHLDVKHINSSAQDDISGETVAIKLVTRVFEKIQLAKRALREITLLRHFQNHENVGRSIHL